MSQISPVYHLTHWKGDGTSKSKPLNLGKPKKLRITGDQTISMWVRPNALSTRMNPYGKCYGGEGTITIQPSGTINYYYGSSGKRKQPYMGANSRAKLTVGKWTHIAVVRDLKARKIRWYMNGKLTRETWAKFGSAGASSLGATVGKG